MNQNEIYKSANTFVLISEFPDYDYFPPAVLGVFDDYDLASLHFYCYEHCFSLLKDYQFKIESRGERIIDVIDRNLMTVWMYIAANSSTAELSIVPVKLNEESISLVLHSFLRPQEKKN